MNDSKISVRYARALFQSALERNITDRVNSDMGFVSEVCSMPEFREILENPVIKPSDKKKVFSEIFRGKVEEITMSLINLVITNGRENYLPAIARVYKSETMKHQGITECHLTTAVKVDDGIRKQIAGLISSLFNTSVDFRENIDGAIIGGFILRVDDNYIDASVRNKLRKIKRELVGTGKLQ